MSASLRDLFAALLLAFATAACTPHVPAATPGSDDAAFSRLEHDYVVYVLARFPVVATYLGGATFDPALSEVDGKLRDASPAAIADEDAHLAAFRDRFAAFTEAGLSPRRRIDQKVALAQIAFLRHQHARRVQERSLDTYVDEPFRGVDWQIQGMTTTGASTVGTEAEWRRVVWRVREIPRALATAEAQLSAGVRAGNPPDGRMLREFGQVAAAADAAYFATTLPELAAANLIGPNRDGLLHDVRRASDRASDAYLHLLGFVAATFFDDPLGGGGPTLKPEFRADRFALGEAEYDWALRNNLRIEKPAAELFAESWPVVEARQRQMIALARTIAAIHGWSTPADGREVMRAVIERLDADAPANDDEMIAAYRAAGRRLVEHARRTGLFAVPADYRLDVTVTPPPLQSSIEGAAYYAAPPFKTTGVGRFYVTPTGNDRALLRQEHNRSAVPDLAAHEGFPGHDWHYKVMAHDREEISPLRWLTPGAVEDSSSMWQDSMATEGWALYAEELLAEPQAGAPDGFYTPEEHLYELRGQLYRDLRVRIDTGIHTGRMSFDEAVTLFSEVVDFIPGSCQDAAALGNEAKRASCAGARSAVGRYARWPTQAITYRLGKEEILALRERARSALGPRFSLQDFHLALMKQGTIPAGYFAGELLREPGR